MTTTATKTETITGPVTEISPVNLGSFRNVKLRGHSEWITVGLGEGGTHPQINELITVEGVLSDEKQFMSNGNWHRPTCDHPWMGSLCYFEDWNHPDILGRVIHVDGETTWLEMGPNYYRGPIISVPTRRFLWYADVQN